MTSKDPPSLDNLPDLLTPGEVAALFRVDVKTVSRWAKQGRIACVRTAGGHRRFPSAGVKALLGVPGR